MMSLSFLSIHRMLALGLCLLLFSCDSSQEQDQASADEISSDSLAVSPQDSVVSEVEEMVLANTPLLDTLLSGSPAGAFVGGFKHLLAQPSQIKSDQDILALLGKRDSLINMLQYDVLEPFYYNQLPTMENSEQLKEDIRLELQQLGLKPIQAEGNYDGLAESPILTERIAAVASEPMKLYLKFQQQYANSLGAEYTYHDLAPEMEIVKIGEALRAKYPNNPLVERTNGAYEEAIIALTDFHLVGMNPSGTIVGGFGDDPYPNESDLSNQKSFIENYPDLALAASVEKLIQNPSHIDRELGDTLHILSMQSFNEASAARGKMLDRINAGIDAPHVLEAMGKQGNQHLWVYRFYSQSSKADSAFSKAQGEYPDLARIKALIQGSSLVLID